jgi:alkylation response protein AidB-like acyl-CoA dehydrogenase
MHPVSSRMRRPRRARPRAVRRQRRAAREPVARFRNDAEALYSYEGTREMNTLIVGRAITGIPTYV